MAHQKAPADKLNWALLHVFLMICEERSLSLAAVRLNITQSAVSHSLKRLEEQVGVKLVERGQRRFAITDHGRVLYDLATKIYEGINEVGDVLKSEQSPLSGTLNLLVLSRMVSDTFDEFFIRFRKRYPKIKIQMEVLPSSEILRKIGQNFPAVGLSLCRQEMKNIQRTYLFPQRYCLFCGKNHPLFNKKRITKKDMAEQDFVSFFSDQLGDSLSPLSIFRDTQQFKGEIVASTNILDEVKRLIYFGYGIGCLPDLTTRQEVRDGMLRKLPPGKGIMDIPIYIVYGKQRRLKAIELAFIEELGAAFDAAPPE